VRDTRREGYCRAMLKHETKLIDPDAEQIVAALSEATAGANKRCRARLLGDDPAKWQKFARDAAAEPEGYAMYRGGKGGVPATQVLAAWWTDAIGRKHVVVRGRRVEHADAKRLLHTDELDARPPLWHAYPEYVCRRTVGKQEQIVCACGCGAVGTPESLGWMGETCGPCFDRKEEAGAEALHANLPGVLYADREPLGTMACSPDGTRVAAVEGLNSVTYWDIATRTRTVIKFSGVGVTDAAVTPDGRHLLVVGVNAMSPGGLFAAFDLSTDPPHRVDPQHANEAPGWRVAALGSDLAVVHRPDPATMNTLGAVVRVPSGEPVRALAMQSGYGGRFAVAPNGKQIATVGYPVVLIDSVTGRSHPKAAPGGATCVAFSADGQKLFGNFSRNLLLAAWDVATGRMGVSASASDWKRLGAAPGIITALAIDPAGAFVYAALSGGFVVALSADTLALRAVFEWHLGSVRGLALSADGSRLFSSGTDGCVKVWPVSTLMKGV
jgi:hypothetical protein